MGHVPNSLAGSPNVVSVEILFLVAFFPHSVCLSVCLSICL